MGPGTGCHSRREAALSKILRILSWNPGQGEWHSFPVCESQTCKPDQIVSNPWRLIPLLARVSYYGRHKVLGHGTRDMPVFGIWFRIPDDEVSIETEWADQVRGRIWQLLSYLESIQEP